MMQDNSDMFEANSHPHVSNFNQIPNLSAVEAPADHFHHQHMMNMEMDYQNHQQLNWNHNLNDQILTDNVDNNFLPVQTQPDLLNLFQLPTCSSSILFSNPAQFYQTSGHIMPPQLLNSLPNGFNVTGCGPMFGEMDMEPGEQSRVYHGGDAAFGFDAGVIDGKGRDNKDAKQFASEKHRRQHMNGKFETLRSLIPSPTKIDRASIIEDAIEYINKLKRDMEELKISVDGKKCNRSRMKKQKTEDDSNNIESIYTMSNCGRGGDSSHDQQPYNGSSTSTWLQRKSNNIEIDVRIIDDEVTIKLVQQKGISCLLLVSKVFDELKLDVHHVAGGHIGGYYCYLFNNKIFEGSCVYASDIANKLIEVVDKQYAATS